jgi:hypothetical protein
MSLEETIAAAVSKAIRPLELKIDALTRLIEREAPAEMTTDEFAERVNRRPFTVRAWCRDGRIQATRGTDSGKYTISRQELLRYQAEGLLEPQSLASAPRGRGAGNAAAVRQSDGPRMSL